MATKDCPVCGLPTSEPVCPTCGANMNMTEEEVFGGSFSAHGSEEQTSESENTASEQTANANAPAKEETPTKKKKEYPAPDPTIVRLGTFHLTIWDLMMFITWNISAASIIINAIIGGDCWCHYVVLGVFAVYYIAYSVGAKTAKKFLSRFKNGVFMLNTICTTFRIVLRFLKQDHMNWSTDYFVPILTIISSLVYFSMLANKNIHPRTAFLNTLFLFPHAFFTLILMCLPDHWIAVATPNASRVLVIVSVSIIVLFLVNITVLWIMKYKNKILKKFRWLNKF